jgi:hypothetical protein
MPHTRWFLAVTLIGLLSSAAAGAAETPAAAATQTQQAILLDTIRANRKAFVAVNLQLSPEEAKSFWPVYDKYQKELGAVGDRMAAIVADYTASFHDLSNDKAVQLMEGYLAAEADRLQVRRAYLAEFLKILPGRTVARFYQIENKMDAVIRYELAASIPVVDEQGGAPAKAP